LTETSSWTGQGGQGLCTWKHHWRGIWNSRRWCIVWFPWSKNKWQRSCSSKHQCVWGKFPKFFLRRGIYIVLLEYIIKDEK